MNWSMGMRWSSSNPNPRYRNFLTMMVCLTQCVGDRCWDVM